MCAAARHISGVRGSSAGPACVGGARRGAVALVTVFRFAAFQYAPMQAFHSKVLPHGFRTGSMDLSRELCPAQGRVTAFGASPQWSCSGVYQFLKHREGGAQNWSSFTPEALCQWST